MIRRLMAVLAESAMRVISGAKVLPKRASKTESVTCSMKRLLDVFVLTRREQLTLVLLLLLFLAAVVVAHHY